MTSYQLIALDMDGTLLASDRRTILATSHEVLAEARRRDIKVILVTGRHHMLARFFHHQLGLDTPIICSNGAYLYAPQEDRILDGDPLPADVLTTLIDVVRREGLDALLHQSDKIVALGFEEYVARIQDWSASMPEHLKIDISSLETSDRLPDGPVWKIELSGTDHVRLREVVERELSILPINPEWASPDVVELVACQSSKGNRLAQWAADEGIHMAQVVAFGDNHNDLSMFGQVGLAVAMGNAEPHIQANAHKVTANNDEDGIAFALRRWVLV